MTVRSPIAPPLGALLLLAACSGGKGEEVTTVTTPTVSTTDTGLFVSMPVWQYEATASDGVATRTTLDGEVIAQLTGYLFSAQPLGPTLVAEPDHQIMFTLDNRTSIEVELLAEGVTVSNAPTIASGQKAVTVMITDGGPGVHAWRMPETGHGLAGLVTVRDPDEFPVLEIDTQVNIVLYQAAADATTVNRCVLDGITDTGGACPAMEPAESDLSLLLMQRLTQTWTPDYLRHGGPPNEFITATPLAPRLQLTEGEDVRINIFNMTESTHTLDLSSLPIDTAGGPVTTLVLDADTGVAYTREQLAGVGIYPVRCLDCEVEAAVTGEIEIVPAAR